MGSTYLTSFLYCSYLILDHIDMLNNDEEEDSPDFLALWLHRPFDTPSILHSFHKPI
jgi:hypothetical protein